ncbi:MAG: hypothetical protein HRF46_13095 [Acidobacteriota bacterium]|jgi:hypothetical protein
MAKKTRTPPRRRSKGRNPGEYFLAALGVALLALVVAMIAHAGSCKVGLSPEVGGGPRRPTPTPAELEP